MEIEIGYSGLREKFIIEQKVDISIVEKKLRDEKMFFLIISIGKENYFQCNGGEGMFTCEFRYYTYLGFKHYRLGHKENKTNSWIVFQGEAGQVRVLEHENFTFDEVMIIIRLIYSEASEYVIREQYILKNITKLFT